MLEQLYSIVDHALGLHLESKDISAWQMSLRALVVFILATVIVRVGNRRFMGKSTALDVMLGIVFGAVVSRAITGNAPFLPALTAGATLVITHMVLTAIAFRFHRFGILFKGSGDLLVEHGQIHWNMMKRYHITERDLQEAMRGRGMEPEIRKIKYAHLERNGDISIIPE
jgi:uncharacterized membrane protein YcaP (DUF421 family)